MRGECVVRWSDCIQVVIVDFALLPASTAQAQRESVFLPAQRPADEDRPPRRGKRAPRCGPLGLLGANHAPYAAARAAAVEAR